MGDDPQNVNAILDRLEQCSRGETASVGELADSLGHRSYAPFLIVPALVDISPVGAVPGLPTVLAAVIFLAAAQIILGREHLWLPGFVERRTLRADRLRRAIGKMRPAANWMDRTFHRRLPGLTKGPFIRGAGLACMMMTLLVPPLELLPLATTAPMAAIAMFGLALLVRDGALMIAAYAFVVLTVALGAGLWMNA